MKEFLLNNWLEIFVCLIGIIEVILVIVKKNKTVVKDTAFGQVLQKLPELIVKAESLGVNGVAKHDFVVSAAITLLKDITGDDYLKLYELYGIKVSKALEDILATPQKKEEE